jgi:hypothetical protein
MKAKVMRSLAWIGLACIWMVLPSLATQSSAYSDTSSVNITGKVSCSRFGTGSITPRKGMSVAQTIQYCVVFQHSYYTLVSGKSMFLLNGDRNELAKMSGKTVTVAGVLSGASSDVATYSLMPTIAVANIVPTKK